MCRCMQSKGAKIGSAHRVWALSAACERPLGSRIQGGTSRQCSPFLSWAKGQLPSAHSVPGTDLKSQGPLNILKITTQKFIFSCFKERFKDLGKCLAIFKHMPTLSPSNLSWLTYESTQEHALYCSWWLYSQQATLKATQMPIDRRERQTWCIVVAKSNRGQELLIQTTG